MVAIVGKKSFHLLPKKRQMRLDDVPENLVVHCVIPVDEYVAEGDDPASASYLACDRSIRAAPTTERFSHDFGLPPNCCAQHGIVCVVR